MSYTFDAFEVRSLRSLVKAKVHECEALIEQTDKTLRFTFKGAPEAEDLKDAQISNFRELGMWQRLLEKLSK